MRSFKSTNIPDNFCRDWVAPKLHQSPKLRVSPGAARLDKNLIGIAVPMLTAFLFKIARPARPQSGQAQSVDSQCRVFCSQLFIFITTFQKRGRSGAISGLVGPLVYSLALTLAPVDVTASGFQVEAVRTKLVDGVYLLNADIAVALSEESLEALDNGVPLTVVVDMDIVQTRKLAWDKHIARLSARNELRIHVLSRKYLVRNLNSDATTSYLTLHEAISALGNLENFPVLDSHLLNDDKSYHLKLRARLDIEALPSPLRPVAYLSSLWRRSSEWSTWPIEN